MNPNNKLKTPAGYKGRTSAAGYNLNFELATRGLIKGWQATGATGPAVKLTNGAEGRSVAVASDGSQHSALYMDDADGIEVKLTKLPTDSWHAIVAIVRALPEGVPERPDNPESVAIFEIPANSTPLTDAELDEHVRTSTSLGNFQGGKWCRIADAFVKANATAPEEVREGEKAQNALGFTITGTAEGNPIEVYDSANAKLVAYEIDGDTTQNRYAGYNLLPLKSAEGEQSGMAWEITPYGVKFSGTPTVSYIETQRVTPDKPIEAGEYTMFYFSDKPVKAFVWLHGENGGFFNFNLTKNNVGQTKRITEKIVAYQLGIEGLTAGTKQDYVLYNQMLSTATPKAFEPYVGGEPSPNPDYPQALESTTITTIQNCGVNLLPQPYKLLTSDGQQNGVKWHINEDYSITLTGTNTGDGIYLNLTDEVDDMLTGNIVDHGSVNGYTITSGTTGRDPYLMSYNSANKLLVIYIGPGKTDFTVKPMIVRNADKDRPYEPYEGRIITLSKPVELNRAGSSRDKIDRKDGIWGVWRRAERTKLQNVSPGYTTETQPGFTYSNIICTAHDMTNDNASTTRFKYVHAVLWQTKTEGFTTWGASNHRGIAIKLKTSRLTAPTAAAVKEWVKNHPFELITELEAPYFEPLPEADQKALNQLQSFNHITYIGTQGNQRVEYILDLAQPIIDNIPEPEKPEPPITITNVDPGEGSPLEAGKFIGVYN